MDLHRLFTEHPESVGESYLQHLMAATTFGVRMVLGGLACLVQRKAQPPAVTLGHQPLGRRAATR